MSGNFTVDIHAKVNYFAKHVLQLKFFDFSDWSDVSTIAELQQKQLDFLRGRTVCTPYHGAPLCPDSQKLVDHLYELNELGFFTVDGQGCSFFQRQNPAHTAEMKQKPYVVGFMLAAWVPPLKEYLNKQKSFIKYSFDFFSGDGAWRCPDKRISNFEEQTVYVTVERKYSKERSQEEIDQLPWELFTCLAASDDDTCIETPANTLKVHANLAELMTRCYCYAQFTIDDFDTEEILEEHLVGAIKALPCPGER